MKRIFATAVVLALIVGALGAPALAGKKKKEPVPPAPQPIPVTLFFHGTEAVGEADIVNNFPTGATQPMDTTEPSGSSKSFPILDGIATPNESCSGSPLFPSWTAQLAGQVKGDVKVTFNTIASVGSVDVELFVDAGPLSCNDTYIEPVGEATVDLPPGTGTVEAVISGLDIPVGGLLTVMINPRNLDAPAAGRILYDSPTDAARVELMCTPNAGATTCTP